MDVQYLWVAHMKYFPTFGSPVTSTQFRRQSNEMFSLPEMLPIVRGRSHSHWSPYHWAALEHFIASFKGEVQTWREKLCELPIKITTIQEAKHTSISNMGKFIYNGNDLTLENEKPFIFYNFMRFIKLNISRKLFSGCSIFTNNG